MEHHILEDRDIRKVFRRIARERIVSYRDLGNMLDHEGEPVRDNLQGLIEQLIDSGLVEQQKAPISDFDTYHLTVDGLAANRTRKNLGLGKRKNRLQKPKA